MGGKERETQSWASSCGDSGVGEERRRKEERERKTNKKATKKNPKTTHVTFRKDFHRASQPVTTQELLETTTRAEAIAVAPGPPPFPRARRQQLPGPGPCLRPSQQRSSPPASLQAKKSLMARAAAPTQLTFISFLSKWSWRKWSRVKE